MKPFSQTALVMKWLANFKAQDTALATTLVDEMMLVSASELKAGIYALIDQVRDASEGPVALYVEREVETQKVTTEFGGWDEVVLPLFKGMDKGRATGPGPNPVPFDPAKPEVGSEGTIANLLTNYCRLHKRQALNHPGPDLLRSRRTRSIVIVSDFLGSGNRVWEMLEAFRKVASFRSWKSFGWLKFFVVAYSGTEEGIRNVQQSSLRPTVLTYRGCPTLQNTFRGAAAQEIRALCQSYPKGHEFPFGYGWSGALIAFEHGVPNNAPALFHSLGKNKKWRPLFPKRSTAGVRKFPESNASEIADRADKILRVANIERMLKDPTGSRWVETMLVLAALSRGATTALAASAQTRLRAQKVDEILEFTRVARWTTSKNRLTEIGRFELRRLRKRRTRTPVLPNDDKPFYYPTQLRAR
jgi:hypothetical protein